MQNAKTGVLLINLGTPNAPDVKSVRAFLREFLSDPCVIDLPWLVRQLILNVFILPFRPQKTAKLYQSIWTDQGSPLLYHSKQFAAKLSRTLGSQYKVALGMRYGSPSLQSAYAELQACNELIIFPLFPQYSLAATGTAILASQKIIAKSGFSSAPLVCESYFDNVHYVQAMAQRIQQHQATFNSDFILFSYHGLPERALEKSGCAKTMCNRIQSCLSQAANTKNCYRAQCFATTRAIAEQMGLDATQYCTAFQSRLGRAQWVRPYTDQMLVDLRARGVKRLLVSCPSFVADCLETLEEINIRLRGQWLALGGEAFEMVPCLNADEAWVKAAATILTSLATTC